MKRRLFVDMDGTLANFHENNKCLELMYKPGYFEHLKPFENAVMALGMLCKSKSFSEVFILSSVPCEDYHRVVSEKKTWLTSLGINLDRAHLLFPLMGSSKVEYVTSATGANLTATDFLLDDYNENLEEWRSAGGTAIKFVNDFNDKGKNGPLWNGKRIRHDWSPEQITLNLERFWVPEGPSEMPMSKKGNMAYWDSIDALAEKYVRSLLAYSCPQVNFGDKFESKEDVIMRVAKEITEFSVNYLENDSSVGATFPYVEGDY